MMKGRKMKAIINITNKKTGYINPQHFQETCILETNTYNAKVSWKHVQLVKCSKQNFSVHSAAAAGEMLAKC